MEKNELSAQLMSLLKEEKISEFNALRTANSNVTITWKNENFSYCLLNGIQLINFEFIDCNFDEVDLSNSILWGSRCTNCTFYNAFLFNCSFGYPELFNANLLGLMNALPFVGAKLESCSFAGADLSNSTFKTCELNKIDFSYCQLVNADFRETNRNSTIFKETYCENTLFDVIPEDL